MQVFARGKAYDCVVVGGGSAGCAAAAAAAQAGCATLLVERHGFLGGMGTAAGLSAFINYRFRRKDLSHSFYRSVIADLMSCEATYSAEAGNVDVFEPEALKRVLETRLARAGVDVWYHAAIFSLERQGDDWALQFFRKSGLELVRTRYVVDATGDADVAQRAGAGVTHGRKSDGMTQPMTMVVQLAGADTGEFAGSCRPLVQGRYIFNSDTLDAEIARARTRGEWDIPRDTVAMFWSMPWDPTRVTINGTRIATLGAAHADALTAAESEGRRQAWQLAAFFTKYVPGFSRARLSHTGPHVGVRETRRIVGLTTLNENDVMASRKPEDSVVLCSYPIDIHQPAGTGTEFDRDVELCYGIPLRCLLPAGVVNVIAAGRCISATHEAAGSFRVMPTCMNLGQAAGCAVGLARASGTRLDQVDGAQVRSVLAEAFATEGARAMP